MINVHTGSQIARTRGRLSMLSRLGLGDLIWPWMWPLHMMALGSRTQRIERIHGASLAIAGGDTGEQPASASRRIGLVTYGLQFTGTIVALLTAILTTGATQIAALLIAAALYGPVLIEGIAMIVNLSIRPGQLMLNHRP